MNTPTSEIRTIIVERELPHAPEKIWRALTQPHLMEEWLMKTAFEPEVGHRFKFSADWGEIQCEVIAIDLHRKLEYSWDAGDLKSVVSWELTPTDKGTVLRMEQTGFKPDQSRYYGGAKLGWPRFLDNLEQVLKRMDQGN
jgi:uncharacterized protein YndB with AHSA1/START domain